MVRQIRQLALYASPVALFLLLSTSAAAGASGDTGWQIPGGQGSMHYSPLQQIDRSNVHLLKKVWEFNSQDAGRGTEIQCNPLVIGGTLYGITPRLHVIALDAATGKLKWEYQMDRQARRQAKRGMAYWKSGSEQRLFLAIDQYLVAIDANTGKGIPSFGDNGRVDLRNDLGVTSEDLSVGASSPGVIYKDLLILGSQVAEDLPAAPGHIRAYDVRTGKVRWIFHTIPQPGEFGYDTWPPGAYPKMGAVNSWPGMTLDEKRGIVYIPVGSAAFDFYGANRIGDNLFSDCVLALKADTGERVWHYQLTHHDVWDRDPPQPPVLVQVKRDGKVIDAVAQATKEGYLWVFDRDTGKPLFPVKEVQVPPSDMEGEKLSPVQRIPEKPASFTRQGLTKDDMTTRTPEAHAWAMEQFNKLKTGPPFTPPSKQGTLMMPALAGGAEWGGSAFDPETGIFYINANESPWVVRLVPRRSGTAATSEAAYVQNCAGCHRANREGSPPEFPSLVGISDRKNRQQISEIVRRGAGRMPAFGRLGRETISAIVDYVSTGKSIALDETHLQALGATDLAYRMEGYNQFLDPDGYPGITPPWGTLNAINLNTGEYVWKQTFGEYPELTAKGVPPTGSFNYGGGIVTAGGLLFIGATTYDKKFHAYDKATGKLLWETTLPASGNATPTTYELNGKQYVVIPAGGGKWGAESGSSYVAFALP